MIVTRVRIVLADGKEQGQVYLQTKFGTAYKGDADTDLKAGFYEMSVDKAHKKWIIKGANKPGLRFYITPDGVDP